MIIQGNEYHAAGDSAFMYLKRYAFIGSMPTWCFPLQDVLSIQGPSLPALGLSCGAMGTVRAVFEVSTLLGVTCASPMRLSK